MKLIRVLAAAAMLFVAAAPALAFTGEIYSNTATLDAQRPPAARIHDAFVVAQAAPASQTTVNTTAPVSTDTTVSVGTLAGEVLTWLADAFSIPVCGLLIALLLRAFKWFGVQVTTQMRDQLQSVVVNGLNAAAKNIDQKLQGQLPIEVKNQIVADAVTYTQTHAADTIKALGLDPQSGAAVQAIKARIETAIADPLAPTPPVLDPPAPPKAA